MTPDTVEWLRDRGQLLLDAGSQFDVFDGQRLIAIAAEVERLRAANDDLEMVASLREQEVERLRAALDEIAHYWSGGPIDPGWKEIARRALEES